MAWILYVVASVTARDALPVVVELERRLLPGSWCVGRADGAPILICGQAPIMPVSGGAGDHCHGGSVAIGVDVVAAAAVNRARGHELGLGVGVNVDAGVDQAQRTGAAGGGWRVGEKRRVGCLRLRSSTGVAAPAAVPMVRRAVSIAARIIGWTRARRRIVNQAELVGLCATARARPAASPRKLKLRPKISGELR